MATEEKVFSSIVLMIDNETLSLRPDACIVQVGYCVANVVTKEFLVRPTDLNLRGDGGFIDANTVRFWANQPDEARLAVLNPDAEFVRPHDVYNTFKALVDSYPGLTVWASPAMFDLPQLTTSWGGRKPWKYGAELDMGTLYKLLDPHGALKPAHRGTQHVASADAEWQMHYLFNLMDKLLRSSAGFEYGKAISGAV